MGIEAIRVVIRRKLQDGRLPLDSMPRLWGGPADGEMCDACDMLITKEQLVITRGAPPRHSRGPVVAPPTPPAGSRVAASVCPPLQDLSMSPRRLGSSPLLGGLPKSSSSPFVPRLDRCLEPLEIRVLELRAA